MKLFELITTNNRKTPLSRQNRNKIERDRETDAYLPSIAYSKNITQMKQGSYGDVYHHKNKPHEVIKVGGDPNDGFSVYIRAISSLSDSNPYFPRVYKTKKYGQSLYTMEMEKLIPIHDLNANDFESILDKIEPGFDPEDANEDGLVGYIINAFNQNKYATGADPLFISAVETIKNINKKYQGMLDIHDENIMIRRTPYGAQLVFTDPLA